MLVGRDTGRRRRRAARGAWPGGRGRRVRAFGRGGQQTAAGFASVEAVIGVGLAFAVILASLALVRGACRLGSDLSRGSDRSVAALWALECIATDLRKAGLGLGTASPDEAVELFNPGALAIRADLDRDDPDSAQEPEARIAGGSERVTTGNDEVLAFLRRSPDHGYGEETRFWADLEGSCPRTMTAAQRSIG